MTGDELLSKYLEQFGEAFPLFSCPGDDDEIIETIKNCLETNTPYEPDCKEDIVY